MIKDLCYDIMNEDDLKRLVIRLTEEIPEEFETWDDDWYQDIIESNTFEDNQYWLNTLLEDYDIFEYISGEWCGNTLITFLDEDWDD